MVPPGDGGFCLAGAHTAASALTPAPGLAAGALRLLAAARLGDAVVRPHHTVEARAEDGRGHDDEYEEHEEARHVLPPHQRGGVDAVRVDRIEFDAQRLRQATARQPPA